MTITSKLSHKLFKALRGGFIFNSSLNGKIGDTRNNNKSIPRQGEKDKSFRVKL